MGTTCLAAVEDCLLTVPKTTPVNLQSISVNTLPVRVPRCGCLCITIEEGVVGGLVDGHLSWLPIPDRRTQSLAPSGQAWLSLSFAVFHVVRRIFLGTNDSAT